MPAERVWQQAGSAAPGPRSLSRVRRQGQSVVRVIDSRPFRHAPPWKAPEAGRAVTITAVGLDCPDTARSAPAEFRPLQGWQRARRTPHPPCALIGRCLGGLCSLLTAMFYASRRTLAGRIRAYKGGSRQFFAHPHRRPFSQTFASRSLMQLRAFFCSQTRAVRQPIVGALVGLRVKPGYLA